MSEEKEIKVVLVGDAGVGKTNLIRVATGEEFNPNSSSTDANSYSEGQIVIKEKKYNYCLWDTAGQEKYLSMNKLFIKNSKIVLIVFSITSRESFEHIDFWNNYIKDSLVEGNYIVALVGNKSDLYEDDKALENEEMQNKAKSLGFKFKITSAKTDAKGFKKFLDEILEDYIHKYFLGGSNRSTSFKINSKNNKDNKDNKDGKKCC